MRTAAQALALCLAMAGVLQAQQPVQKRVTNHDRDRAQHFFIDGGKAIAADHLDAAVTAFAQALALDPGNRDYDAALAIARDNLATQLMQQALKARMLGDNVTWRARMKQAAIQDSHNPLVLEHENDLVDEVPKDAVLNQMTDDAGPPVVLKPDPGVQSFHLQLPQAQLLRQVMSAYGISAAVDSSIPTEPVRFDADEADFAQAQQMLTLATGSFVVPLDPRRALLALDTKENRGKYERLALETVYLPGLTSAELTDVSNIARNVFEAQQATVHEASNTMTVRAPAVRMNALNFELNELLAGRSETVLDINMYEVQRERMANEGAELPQSTTLFNLGSETQSLIANNPQLVQQIISSGLASPGNIEEIAVALVLSGQAGSTLLSQPFAYFGGGLTTTGLTLSSAAANAQLNTSETRMVDRIQLRLLDQEEGSLKIGERYPIVTSSYSNLQTGSTSIAGITSAGLSNTLQNLGVNLASLSASASATIPQVQYQDLGLILNATPRIEQGRDVSLKLRLQLSSLSGQSANGNPVLNNRQFNSVINVKPGEKTVLVSQISNQEATALIGIPLLSEIPGFEFGTDRTTDHTRDSLIIVITPHIVRLTHTHAEGQMVLLPAHS